LLLRLWRLCLYYLLATILVAGAVMFSGIGGLSRSPSGAKGGVPPPASGVDGASSRSDPDPRSSATSDPKSLTTTDPGTLTTPAQEARTHRVDRGQTLWRISQTYSVTIEALKQANGLESETLIEGQLLVIPQTAGVHIIKEGETLWQISRRYQVPLEDLARLNQLVNPGELQVGQEILIPKEALVAAKENGENADNGDNRQHGESDPSPAEPSPSQPKTASGGGDLIWPVQGVISSTFGPRRGKQHSGLDIAAPKGTPIKAAKAGTVVTTGWLGGYGQTVILEHSDKTATLYAHASKILVRKGQKVKQGETIARVGTTGRSTGPHVHFEVIVNSRPRDPITYLPKRQTAAKQR
jgi:murein DD-endopeptidase MepM/ murein hydrolase activator NlpD